MKWQGLLPLVGRCPHAALDFVLKAMAMGLSAGDGSPFSPITPREARKDKALATDNV